MALGEKEGCLALLALCVRGGARLLAASKTPAPVRAELLATIARAVDHPPATDAERLPD
ncbi:hypothetical protein [Streptomyces sp. NPDC048638]|uniref:hypothetical protein n=1 Tax=Streptomyces sp. NPDC048638 TaxID=3365580 RepID=UPI003713BA2A